MDTSIIITLFYIVQLELFIMITIILILLIDIHRKRNRKPDPIHKHVKEFLIEGYTLEQIRKKLEKLGFGKERIEKLMHDFLKSD